MFYLFIVLTVGFTISAALVLTSSGPKKRTKRPCLEGWTEDGSRKPELVTYDGVEPIREQVTRTFLNREAMRVRNSRPAIYQEDPIEDFRAMDLQIDERTLAAILHHLGNGLMAIQSPDPDGRARGFERLRKLATALRQSYARWKETRNEG